MNVHAFSPPKARSGLRNRYRNGRSTYCLKKKGTKSSRDRYGQYYNGQQRDPDIIAGRTLRLHVPLAGRPEGR